MNRLASAIIYTSQGISFTLAGEEMARSKDGDTNSYKSAADLNMIKWQNVVDYADVVSYYKGMMQIKSAFSPLTAMDNHMLTNTHSQKRFLLQQIRSHSQFRTMLRVNGTRWLLFITMQPQLQM